MGLGKFDLNLLDSFSQGKDLEKMQEIFNSLTVHLEEKLGSKPHESDIKVTVKPLMDEESLNFDDPFEFGVSRFKEGEDDRTTIQISSTYMKFVPQILLREAYKSFINPLNLKNVVVQFVVYNIIESELENLDTIRGWKKIIRKQETFQPYFARSGNSLIKFFKLEDPDTNENLIPFFIRLINSLDPDLLDDAVLDTLIIEFMNLTKLNLQDDGILETIKVLKEIFFSVKNYRALLDYQDYFKKFKESGFITSDLSLRKFTSNVRWLNKHAFCAPNYHLNWFTINMTIYNFQVRFHPYCRWNNIKVFLDNVPFFFWSQLSSVGYAREFFGYIIIPNSYRDDLKQSLEFFKDTGFFYEIKLFELRNVRYFLNLNYYRELAEMDKILHSQRKGYRKDFELFFKAKYQKKVVMEKLSLLDFLILDRARVLSFSGFGFERRESTLKILKSDLLNEISYQRNLLVQLRNVLDRFSESPELKEKFFNLVQNNKKYGSFIFKEYVEQVVKSLKLATEILKRNTSIRDPFSFKNFIEERGISMILGENFKLDNQRVRNLLVKQFIPLYFQDRSRFDQEFQDLKTIHEYLSVCGALKIFKLNSMKGILENPGWSTKVHDKKEEKLDLIYRESQLRTITSQEVENRLEYFSSSDPPIISPKLIDTMISFLHSTISFILVAKNTRKALSFIETLSHSVPTYMSSELKEVMEDKDYIFCRFGIPGMDMSEKYEFYSIIHNYLKEDLMIFARYIHQGFYSAFSRRSFYNFTEGNFFYTAELFPEFRKQVSNKFGKNLVPLTVKPPKDSDIFWVNKRNLVSFIDDLNQKRMVEPRHFDISQLNQLVDFNKKLRNYLLNAKAYHDLKEKQFFKLFIDSIRFKPILQDFGLQKYYVYFQAKDFDDISPELLLINSFLSVRFNSTRRDTYNFLVKYVFPYNTPSKKYFNWLLFSKKNLNEYCLFTIKKRHEICDFSKNITPEGWRIDFNLFTQHVQKILFDPSFTPHVPNSKTLNFEKKQVGSHISPNDPKFKDLLKIIDKKSNIKSFWGIKKGAKIEPVVSRLLQDNLIHPTVKFKNLKLRECLCFIIPDLNEKQVKILMKLFKFFNVVVINEIEGEYYIPSHLAKSRDEELIKFDQGLAVKIRLPTMEISKHLELMFNVLEHLNVEHYIFFSELFKIEKWPDEVFSDVDLKNNYNPLLNLKWNDTDKIFMNHKLFTENFTPQYPSLKPKKEGS